MNRPNTWGGMDKIRGGKYWRDTAGSDEETAEEEGYTWRVEKECVKYWYVKAREIYNVAAIIER